jgi:hypothetical protein
MVVLVAAFAGCSDDDENPIAPTPLPEMGEGSMLRVVHASPNAPAVDIYAKGIAAPIWSGAAYGATTDYQELAEGTYNIQLRGAGSAPDSPIAFETGPITVPDGVTITAIAMGDFNSGDDADEFRVQIYVEEFDPAAANTARVRVIHASPDAPTVQIDLGNDESIDVDNFARFAETGKEGVALPAGQELQVGIRVGGASVTAFTTPSLPDGADLFVIATGFLGKLPREMDGFSLLAVGPAGTIGFIKQNPVVFALHGSPNAPGVDIYAGPAKLVTDLTFGNISANIQVPPGAYTLDFTATGSTEIAASATTPALAAGERYLAIASGFLNGTPAFTLIPVADAFDPSAMSGTVRVVHASPDAPPVDVGTVDGNGDVTAVADFTNLGFENASTAAGTTLPAGNLPIGIAATGTTPAVAQFTVPVSSMTRAFAVAAGSLMGNGEAFRLLVVDTTVFPWGVATINPN